MKRIIIILVFSLTSGCSETPETKAQNYEQVLPLITAGWLPKSATSIREAHNIDTNSVVASFNVNDRSWAATECERIGPFDAPQPDLRVNWWPGDVPANQFSTYRHVFYRCSSKAYFAITPDGEEANYWSNSQ
ncbi:MAG: hypothetical protein ACKVJE_12405 [Pseudomonadales bacterium]